MPVSVLTEYLRERVRVVSGDVALVQFGLSEEDYHFLTYDIDVVVHSAAYVNLIYPYQALHGINVLGTRNVLDFCHQNKVKPLHYIRYPVEALYTHQDTNSVPTRSYRPDSRTSMRISPWRRARIICKTVMDRANMSPSSSSNGRARTKRP